MNRIHLDHDNAIDLFCNAFENGCEGDSCFMLATVDYVDSDRSTKMHFAHREPWTIGSDSEVEFEMVIKPRHCILRGESTVADAVTCLRAYADQLMKAATDLETAEVEYLERRERVITLPNAGLAGKAVTA